MGFVSPKKPLVRRAVRAWMDMMERGVPAHRPVAGFTGLEALESRVLLSATLQFTPSQGTVTTENGETVVTVAPGTAINFTAALANGSDAAKSFQLDFANSASQLALSNWLTNASWSTQSDSTLGSNDSIVAASNGSAVASPSTLGTFTVTAPQTPGDYQLTADDSPIFSGTLYYTLFINRVKEAIEEGPFPSTNIDGFNIQPTAVSVTSVNGGLTTKEVDNQDYQNIFKIDYSYDPTTHVFTTGAPQFVAQTLGADGIVQANSGADLLIGGQANQVFEVPSGGGTVQTANLPADESFHLSVDPSGTSIWTSDEPGNVLVNVPLNNFGSNITTLNVTGDEITQLGFAPALTAQGNFAYYTKSNRDGGAGDDGSWGIINLTTGVATPVQSNIDGPHSIVFDSYTGDMMMYGDHTITQVDISDPLHPTVVSTLDVSSELNAVAVNLKFTGTATATVPFLGQQTVPVTNFDTGVPLSVLDQGAVDGFGHAFIATNSGYAVVLDYSSNSSAARLVGNATVSIDQNTGKLPFVAEYLDDFSPVVSPTSQGGTILTAGDNSGISVSNFDNVIVRVAQPAALTDTINLAQGQSASTSASPINYTVVFSAPVTDFATGDVTLGGTAGATTAVVTGSGTTYNVAVSGMTQTGTVIASLATGVAHDGNNTANDASTGTGTVNFNQPVATLSATANIAVQPVDATHYQYTITLNNTGGTTIGTFWYAWLPNEDFLPSLPTNIVSPTGWTAQAFPGNSGGHSIQWKATSTNADLAAGDSLTTFQFESTDTPAQISGNFSAFPDTPIDTSAVFTGQPLVGPEFDFVVSNNFDVSQPTVTVNPAAGQLDPTSASPVDFTVVFSKPVTDFTASDLSLTGTTVTGTLAASVTPLDDTTYDVAISGMTGSGNIVIAVPAGVTRDDLGNPNAASTGSNSITFNKSVAPHPTVSVTASDPNASESTRDPGVFTIQLDQPATTEVDVSYDLIGTAQAGKDYLIPVGVGTAVIPAGQSSATVTITPKDAHLTSGSKTVEIIINAAQGYNLNGNESNALVTIADDDVAPPPATPDLTVAFALTQIVPTAVVPGDSVTVKGTVDNSGGTGDAVGPITVNAYILPADQALPNGDQPIATATIKNTIAAGATAPFSIKVPVPGTIPAGSYHLVFVVTPVSGETNTSNNSFASPAINLALALGAVDGHKAVTQLTVDGIGYAYSGPGTVTVVPGQDGQPDTVQVAGTTSKSSLTITAPKGSSKTFGDITITGSAKALNLANITLAGDVTVDGTVATLKLGNVSGGQNINITGNDPTGKLTLAVTAGTVSDLSVNSSIPIKSISVAGWDNTDATPDVITAPSIGTITSKADFEANVTVTSLAAKASLGTVSAKGILESIIQSAGTITSITAGRIVNSLILVGVNPAANLTGLPVDGTVFVAAGASIGKVTATGIKNDPNPSFVNSDIVAPTVGTVSLKDVAIADGSVKFGVAAHLLKSLTRTGKPTVKNLSTPGDNDADGDFVLRIV